MRMPRWLDRLWLVLIALSAAIAIPLWLILSVERMGWRIVLAYLFVAGWLRYSPTFTDPNRPHPSRPGVADDDLLRRQGRH